MTQEISVPSPWDIVAYEAQMLFDLCRLIDANDFKKKQKLEKNAIVESTCLHMRILIDVLTSKDSGRGDDIRLDQLLPGFQHDSVDRLREAYKGDGPGSPCWTLNKMIAHPTLKRGTTHDYTSLVKKLLPLVEEVWQAIQNHPGRVTRTLPETTGGIDPRFCAKTSS